MKTSIFKVALLVMVLCLVINMAFANVTFAATKIKTVTVKTVPQFLKAIKPNTTIKLNMATLDLTKYVNKKYTNYTKWKNQTLIIKGVKNFSIIGIKKSPTKIVIKDKSKSDEEATNDIKFQSCSKVTLKKLLFYKMADGIEFYNVYSTKLESVTVDKSIYGLIYAIAAKVSFKKCTFKNTNGATMITADIDNKNYENSILKFDTCTIKNNVSYQDEEEFFPFIELSSTSLEFKKCTIKSNKAYAFVYDNAENISYLR